MMNSAIRAVVILSIVVTLCNAQCNPLLGSGLEEGDKELILERHNHYRDLVSQGEVPGQPQATNVFHLQWDDSLAHAAHEVALTCKNEHVRVPDDRFPSVGQCLFYLSMGDPPPGPMWPAAIGNWYNEYEQFIFPNGSKGGDITHYRQLVWANTHYVGCSMSWYQSDENDYHQLYVCNYGPGGGVEGQAPYETV